jgi:hypothetical protein
MVAKARTIDLPAESETAAWLREADDGPVIFVVDDAHYRVVREPEASAEDDIWAGYDPQKAIDGMRAAAGSLSAIDAEAWKADFRRWRAEGSREPEDPEPR